MKRLSVLFAALFGISILLTSCTDDCLNCAYTEPITGDLVSEELCGSDDDLAAFQFAFEAAAAFLGTTATCD